VAFQPPFLLFLLSILLFKVLKNNPVIFEKPALLFFWQKNFFDRRDKFLFLLNNYLCFYLFLLPLISCKYKSILVFHFPFFLPFLVLKIGFFCKNQIDTSKVPAWKAKFLQDKYFKNERIIWRIYQKINF